MDLLGIKNLTKNELNKAFKSRAKLYHPDNQETGDEVKFLLIKDAYDYLKKFCVQKIIIKVNLTDIILGTYVSYENISFSINPKTLKKLLFKRIKFKDKEIQIKVVNDNGFRLTRNKGKFIITKWADLTFDDYARGYYALSIKDKGELIFETPTTGLLSSTRKLSNDVYVKVNYKIVVKENK